MYQLSDNSIKHTTANKINLDIARTRGWVEGHTGSRETILVILLFITQLAQPAFQGLVCSFVKPICLWVVHSMDCTMRVAERIHCNTGQLAVYYIRNGQACLVVEAAAYIH